MSITPGKRTREEITSTTTGKRSRIEETNVEPNNTKGESSGLSGEFLGNGDTEIFSTLIPMMKDVYVLKICRLVCKSWNQFASRALRKLPRVYYPVDEDCPEETESRLNVTIENLRLGLPSPFRIFKMSVSSFREKYFLKFLKNLSESAINCCLDLHICSNDVDQAELQTTLTINQENVKISRVTLLGEIIEADEPGQSVFQPEGIRLPFLTSLAIWDEALIDDRLVVLCENICRHSPLKSLKIGSYINGDKLKKVMSSVSKKPLETFYLEYAGNEHISYQDWENVCARIMEFPSIKKLIICEPELEPEPPSPSIDDNDAYEDVIANLANSVEVFKGHFPWLPDPFFPKLREINDGPIAELKHFPVESFPVLKKLTLSTGNRNHFHYPTVDKSPGIEELCFDSPAVTEPDLILKFISSAGIVFPNVTIFSMDQCAGIQFSSAMLSVICQSFPKMSALELRVNLQDDKTLSGLRLNVDEWLKERWPLEKIPREASLLDFSGLEKLTLGPQVSITRHLFLHCLSKISKLQFLIFYLNGDLSAIDVRDSVGHLTRIKVIVLKSLNPREKWVEEMERLRIMLPSIVEIKIKIREFNK